jgi:hypothetical protein
MRCWRSPFTTLATGLCAAALAAAGCGSSSSSSSSTTTAASSSTTSSSTAATGAQPLSKAEYESKLGPLLNLQVAPALHVAFANGGARHPQNVTAAIGEIKLAHDRMAALTPPTAVADLHRNAVAVLAAMITDMTKLRDAEKKSDTSAEVSAAKAVKGDALQLQSVGNKFTARGY